MYSRSPLHSRPPLDHPPAKLRVSVPQAVDLQRVLTVLTGRNHPFTRFAAEEATSGGWSLTLDLTAAPDQLDLVRARLLRLPCVLAVEVRSGV
jgi:hypothetical protein